MDVKKCRNCGSQEVIIADNALMAPFFAKRVHGLEPITLTRLIEQKVQFSQEPFKVFVGNLLLKISRAPLAKFFFQKSIFSAQAKTRTCTKCGFVGPDLYYTEEMLQSLYSDYRSLSYDEDRCLFEPSYREIANLVGKAESEVIARQANMSAILQKCVDFGAICSVLDWGGGDGRFVPTQLVGKQVTVLDPSNDPNATGFLRVTALGREEQFDYVQVCHVLEHIGNPRLFLQKIVKHVKQGGHLYIEVPKDRCDSDLKNFKEKPASVSHLLHEHLNLYCSEAVFALASSVGLKTIDMCETQLDLGWTRANVICGVFLKPPEIAKK